MDKGNPLGPGQVGRRTILVLKGSAAYGRWVDQISRASRIPRAILVDLALTEWAQSHGHESPPDRLREFGGAEASSRCPDGGQRGSDPTMW